MSNDNIFVAKNVIVKKGSISPKNGIIILSAANNELKHTGGVARAICKAAGGQPFQKECSEIIGTCGPVPDGDAVVTGAGSLAVHARMIPHAG